MPRTFTHPQYGISVEVPDDATDEQINAQMLQAEQAYQQRQVGAGAARKGARADIAEQLRENMAGALSSELTRPGGPSEDIPPVTGFEPVFDPANPLARGIVRHGPGIAAGIGAGMLAGPGAGLATRAGVQAGVTGLTEALAGGVAGEDPVEAGGKGLLYGLLGEAGGTALGKTIPYLAAPFRSKLIPEAITAQETLGPLGARLTPSQMTSSRALDILENIGMGGLFGGRSIPAQRAKAVEVAQDLMRQYRLGFPEKRGALVKGLYNESDALTKGIRVDLTEAYNLAQELVRQDKGRNPAISKLAGWIRKLGKEVEEVPTTLAGLKGETKTQLVFEDTPFLEVKRLRSDLLAVGRQVPGELATGKAHGAAQKLVNSVHEAMDIAAQGADPRAYGAWRLADETYKQAKFGNFVESLMKKGASETEEFISGAKILTALNRTSKDKLAIFEPHNIADLKEFAQVLEITQRKDPEGLGKVWIQLVQGGAATGLASKGLTTAAGITLVGPRIISWAMTNPATAKLLTTGFRAPGTETSRRAIGLLIGQMSGRLPVGSTEEPELYRAPWETGP